MSVAAVAMVVALATAAEPVEAKPAESKPAESKSESSILPLPPWLPRGAAIGFFVNSPQVTPHVRLSWELALYERHLNDFVAVLTLGTGMGLALHPRLKEHYQHVALGGVGYRSNHASWQWGFQLQLGAVWYRAAYAPKEPYRFESRVLGYAEGRLQVGLKLANHLVLGVYGGYASPWEFNPVFPANIYVGGLDFGLYLDWR